MKDNVSVILERIQGNSLLYCVYTLNLRYTQDGDVSFSDNTTLLVRDQKSRNRYLSKYLDQSRTYKYNASGIIRMIDDEIESTYIYEGIDNLIRKGGVPDSSELVDVLMLEEGTDVFAGATSVN